MVPTNIWVGYQDSVGLTIVSTRRDFVLLRVLAIFRSLQMLSSLSTLPNSGVSWILEENGGHPKIIH